MIHSSFHDKIRRLCEHFLDILAILLPLSEIAKQIILTHSNGGSYIWWYFPFQLCSMPLYLLPLRQLLVHAERSHRNNDDPADPSHQQKRQALIHLLTDFLTDFCLLGGIFVFCDQSGLHYSLWILTVHSYLWHITMILLGIVLILIQTGEDLHLSGRETAPDSPMECGSCFSPERRSRKTGIFNLIYLFLATTLRSYQPCALLFLILAALAECINAAVHSTASINMFYISLWEPVTQAVFRDIAAVTGTYIEVLIYMAAVLFGGFLFHTFSRAIRLACTLKCR